MPSTYTTNLGIEKIGTGEQSGTWGTTTNTNFDLIDQAVNGVAQVVLASAGTSGSPNDLPVNNGSLSDGRNKFIEFTDGGDLGATAYVQLTPNDADKVVFLRNSLTGGRSVIVFQGTYNASNDFEIPNGADVVLKFDGAGAGAVVSQVFEDLTISAITLSSGSTVSSILDQDDMSSDSDTALATQQSIKAYVDSQVGTVDTLSEILANGNTSGATDLVIDNGQVLTTNTINETTAASGVTIDSVLLKDDGVNATNLEITNIKANDGTSAGSIANSTGVVTLASSVLTTTDINGGSVDGVTLGTNSAVTEAQIDNININGNTISSTDTDGNIAITPDGTGEVDISKVDIDGGTIDGVTIATSDITVGAGKTLDVSAGTLTLANDQISGDAINGGTATPTTVTSTTVNATTVDTTNLEVTNLKAKDGASAGSIADSTGVVTFASTVLTTTDINGGTVDGANIGASTPGTGVFTSLETEGAFTEDADAITSSSNAATLDLSAATNFTHDLSENVTYTFSNPAASGKASAFTLKVVQDSAARTITWPASVDWPAGTAPTISTGDGDVDYFVFITTDNGTTYYGFTAGQALATP
jgi:hypothetical protein